MFNVQRLIDCSSMSSSNDSPTADITTTTTTTTASTLDTITSTTTIDPTDPSTTTTINTPTDRQEKEVLTSSSMTTTIIAAATHGCNFQQPQQQPEKGTATTLINLVKPYPELYDKTHQLYCNNVHKGVLWQKIAEEIGGKSTAKKTREQFSYMRKRFRNEYEAKKKGIQKALVPEPDASNYRPPLFVYEQLSFMEEIFEKEDAQEQLFNEAKEAAAAAAAIKSENELKISSEKDTVMDSEGSMKDEALQIMKNSSSKGSTPRKRPRIQTPTKTTPSSSTNQEHAASSSSQSSASSTTIASSPKSFDPTILANILTSSFNSHQQMHSPAFKEFNLTPPAISETTDDECAMFGRQVALDLQRLNVHTRLRVRQKITKILLELYLKQCESNNTQ